MKIRKVFLVIVLLSLSFCFVSGVGYGEIQQWAIESKASYLNVELLKAEVHYMMRNPTSFLNVSFSYDPTGYGGEVAKLPKSVNTKGKIFIIIGDNRDQFSYKSGIALLDTFKKSLEVIYSFINLMATNKDVDVVALFLSKEEIYLGYFSEGEYHLWEE